MLNSVTFVARRRALAAGLLCLATLTGCGLARNSRWGRSAVPVAPPTEPGYNSAPREYSPQPVETTPIERPLPIFPDDPPPPSTSEYLAPPHQSSPSGWSTFGERPGLISPQNARRLPAGNERPTSAEKDAAAQPSFQDGPVASHQEQRTFFTRFQQVDAREAQ